MSLNSIIKLQSNGSKLPLFGIHSINGHARCYRTLSRELGNDRPFYGLENINLEISIKFYPAIEEMVISYINQIKLIQPSGPYNIIGWCFGTYFAYEVSRQLELQGETVDHLFLIAPLYKINIDENDELGLGALFGEHGSSKISIRKKDLKNLGCQEAIKYTIDRIKSNYIHEQLELDELELRELQRFITIHLINFMAVDFYQLKNNIKNITLLNPESSDNQNIEFEIDKIDWQKHSRETVKNYMIPGDNFSILEKPYVKTLAHYINQIINETIEEI